MATASARARRAGTAILVAASDFAGLAVAVDLGLLLMLLAFGRLPVGAQLDLVDPALLGMLLVATLRGAAGQADRAVARARRSPGVRRSPDELLADVGDRARRTEPVAELLRPLAESMRRDWRLSSVRIWTGPQGRLGRGRPGVRDDRARPARRRPARDPAHRRPSAACSPGSGWPGPAGCGCGCRGCCRTTPDPPQMRFAPAVDGSRVLALVVIERAADAAAFTGADERALAAVAGRLAIELRSRALDEALQATLVDLRRSNAELQASRARIVAAATAERRRIERDLHDGAQQHLVALAVGLRLLRDGLPARLAGPRAARRARPRRARRRRRAAQPRARHLPAAAARRGAGRGAACGGGPQPGRRHGRRRPAGHAPSEAVEAAVYFCCLEALQNVAKHAPGARVTIRLAAADGELRFTVADDGPGFDPAAAARGAGLHEHGRPARRGRRRAGDPVDAGRRAPRSDGRVPVGAGTPHRRAGRRRRRGRPTAGLPAS